MLQLLDPTSETAAPSMGDLLDRSNLTQSQLAIWLGQQLNPDTPLYNMIRAFTFAGDVDVPAFQRAFQALIAGSDAMRTVIAVVDGVPQQRVLPQLAYEPEFVDFSGLDNPAAAYDAWLAERKVRPLALDRRLFDAALLKLGPARYVWYLNRHHIITDGWSTALIYQQVHELYQRALHDDLDGLEPLPAFQDYLHYERKFRQSRQYEKAQAYWQNKLASPPEPLRLYGRPLRRESARVARVNVDLGPARTQALRDLAGQKGVRALTAEMSMFNLLSTLLFVYLHKVSGNQRLAIGTPFHNRSSAAFKQTIGIFMEMCLLEMTLTEDDTFLSLLKQGLKESFTAFRHAQPGTSSLVSNKTYEVMLNYITAPFTEFNGLPTTYEWLHVGYGDSNHGLRLQVHDFDGADSIRLQFDFNTEVFPDAQQQRAIAHFLQLLDALLADPAQTIAGINLVTAAEARQLQTELAHTAADYPLNATLIEHFEAQAAQHPERIALQFEDQVLNYAQLNERANQLAHHLHGLGLTHEDLVGICMERSPDMAIAILGVLKAGGAYVPLDPDYPTARLAFMLQDTGLPLLLTQSHLRDHLPSGEATILCLDSAWPQIAAAPSHNLPLAAGLDSLMYVMYTSGSTGRPKGVMLHHAGIANRVLWAQKTLNITVDDRVLQKASFSFDASVWEFFLPLISGARLVMARPGAQQDNAYLRRLIRTEAITVAHFIPSLLQLFLAEPGVAAVCASLRWLWCGGEVLPRATVDAFYEFCPQARIVNGYGPTEGSINASAEICDPADASQPVPIGRPLGRMAIYLLDNQQQLVPLGVPGELYIGGVGVARGYLNRPELTAERFLPDPFSDDPAARLYRTGDLARFRADGKLVFLGRVDQQVKIHGIRIEVGEIEAALRQHPALSDAVVAARPDHHGDLRLVAYIVAGAAVPAATELRTFLRAHLPAYMLPSVFVPLPQLPLTPNGKLDRRALPQPEAVRSDAEGTIVPPRTATEAALLHIWQEVLGHNTLGVSDNFFEVGGHSLAVIKVMFAVRQTFALELPLPRFFESPTLAELAAVIDAAADAPQTATSIQAVAETGPARLSFAQERLWFLDQLQPGSPAYNIHGAVRLRGRLDVTALTAALQNLVQRHEILRTAFTTIDVEPKQLVLPELTVPLSVIDLQAVPDDEQADVVAGVVIDAARKPFELNEPPLLRLTLLRLGAEEHVLVLVWHHLIADEWSTDVFWRELAALYQTHISRSNATLPPLPIQYRDFARWQRERFAASNHSDATYWMQQLGGTLPLLQLPTDYPRPREQRFEGGLVSLTLPREMVAAVQSLNVQAGTTTFMTLLAAFAALLHRYSGQDDIIIGSPIANRGQPETQNLIGLFLNTLALRSRPHADQRFRDLLAEVRQTALDAYAHQDMPFEQLVDLLKVDREPGVNPVFQVMLVYQQKAAALPAFGELHLSRLPLVDSGTAKFDLTLFVHEHEEGFGVAMEYNRDLFEQASIERMLGHFQVLLAAAVGDADQLLGELPLLTPSERRQLLVDWNQTEADFPQDRSIHHLISAQAVHHPAAVALRFGSNSLTYAELDQRATQLAVFLQTRGVKSDVPVGLCFERSFDMFIAILGVLKAGGAYVPLDPAYPAERLRFALDDTQTPLVLTQSHLLSQLPDTEAAVIDLEATWPEVAAMDATLWQDRSQPGDMAYIIYTSGSTGQPKGVPIRHRNLVHSTQARLDYYPESVRAFLLLSSFSFDSSMVGIFGTLCQGGTLVLPPPGGEQDLPLLAALIARYRVSHLLALPSLYGLLLEYAPVTQLESLAAVIVAGERCAPALVAAHYRRLPHTNLYNEYGPTEGTVWSTVYRIPETETRASIPIGRPIANMQTYVLGERQQLLPIGVPGELYIGGAGLAEGYLNRPELTTECFVPHPFNDDPAARLYRTGDLVRYLPDGNLEFLGRVDNQVKIRGYRIELDEIGVRLQAHASVQDAVVIAAEVGTEWQLVAYVVAATQNLEPQTLRAFLAAQLPDYMLPAVFVVLDHLPLTPNGKVDRRALPIPTQSGLSAGDAVVPPRDVLEFQLARIWEAVLQVEQVGIHDNFFELGGQSLLAVRLVNEIERQLTQKVPLAALFQAPTLAELARLLRTSGWSTANLALVPIQNPPQTGRPPLYLVPGNLGNVFTDLGLVARHLPPEQPLYGLQDGVDIPSQVPAMAAHYLREIRQVQAEGPYYLGGICSGGVVAYEMAQQLQAAGEEVALLALVEAFPHENRLKSVWSIAGRFLNRLRRREEDDVEAAEESENETMNTQERGAFLRLKAKVVTNMLGVTRYSLKPYSGPIDAYFCDESLSSPYQPVRSWEQVAGGGFALHALPGTHNDITGDHGIPISEAVMASLAQQLNARIETLLRAEANGALT